MNKVEYHYVGLEHNVRVLESALEVQVVQGSTTLYVKSNRPLSKSELSTCMQSNPEVTPLYEQKWAQLTDQENKSFLEAREKGEEDRFLDTLFVDPSRIVASKSYSNPQHQYFALVENTLKKEKRKKN